MSEFKNLPSGWKVVRLGEICDFYKGKGISKDDISENGIFCIRYGELYTTYSEKIDKIYSKTNLNTDELFLSKCNDIIIPCSGETAQDIAKASCVLLDGIALGGDLNVLRTRENGIFLSYYLNVIAKKDIAKIAQGVSIVHLYASELKNLKIKIPSVDEQKKIAEILSTWDEAINLTINLIESKKQFKKALMQNLLTAKINWNTTTLGSTGEIITGSTPSTTNEKFWNGEIAWITPTDIGDKKDIFIGERSITQDGLKATRELPANSLLVTCIASIGKNAVLKVKGSCNQQINALIPNKNFNVDFLYYLLEFEKERLKNLAGITATLIISKALFSKFKISFPNIIEQQKIAEVLTACDDEINLLNLKLENLKKQKQGLMQKLLKGEIRTCYVKKAM